LAAHTLHLVLFAHNPLQHQFCPDLTQHKFFDPSPESASACSHRDTIGDSAIIGDDRWAGTFGVKADFVATTHCSVAFISTQEIQVTVCEQRPLCMLFNVIFP
jgi:hypothetical protein